MNRGQWSQLAGENAANPPPLTATALPSCAITVTVPGK
jgi:hypothetical protein